MSKSATRSAARNRLFSNRPARYAMSRFALGLLRRFLLFWLAACWLAWPAQAQPPAGGAPHKLLFIATSNVPKGKFHELAKMAAPYGLAVDSYIVPLGAGAGALEPQRLKGHEAVLLDLPMRPQTLAAMGDIVKNIEAPYFAWLHESETPLAGGFDEKQLQNLIAYYENGGERNMKNFLALLSAIVHKKPAPADLPAPVVFPKSAVYHPKAPDLVFASVPEFLKFKGLSQAQIQGQAERPPIIALSIHQEYISGMQTGFIDDLVQRIEKTGAIAMPIYDRMLPAGDIGKLLRPFANEQPDAAPLADAIVSFQITLNAEGRRKEFEELGLPVIQATTYRTGDEAAWAADEHGLPMASIPFYMTQPEMAGVADIQIASAVRQGGDEAIAAIPAQMQSMADKALNLAALRRKPNAQKELALIFWNHPGGEKNVAASFMNVPRSLISVMKALRAAGYDVPEPPEEEKLIADVQRLLAPGYRDGELPGLLKDGLAALLPVAQYRQWLQSLPAATQAAMRKRWGEPERSAYVIQQGGKSYFVIPRLQMGRLALLPLMGRSDKGVDKNAGEGSLSEAALYHSTKADALPPHSYLAAYLWVRQGAMDEKALQAAKKHPLPPAASPARDALIHFGTHGTQEWLPGKERGLSLFDPPMLAVGDVPVVYPYIIDNVGEATQAKRRGRAVTISHQTAALRPAGLHDKLEEIHELLHKWLAQDEGAVKAQYAADILKMAEKERLMADMAWAPEKARAEFPAFVDALHVHLHELAQTIQPIGLHTFGEAATPGHRIATAMMMLGQPYQEAAARQAGVPESELDEALVINYEALDQNPGYRLLADSLDGKTPANLPEELQKQLEQGKAWWQALDASSENEGLLQALAGRYVPTSTGGDPVRNPDTLRTGRNLYGFDPSRVPPKQAWEAGKKAGDALIEAHRQQNGGKYPAKIAFSLWSAETMRHQGLLEAQALWLMGVEPVWNAGGRVEGVRLIPRQELGRPRVDVVISATGLYRDHFPNIMEKLAQAAKLASEAEGESEADNPIAANTRRIASKLRAGGMSEADALDAAQTRIFSSASGRYGTGINHAAMDTDQWQGKAEGDRKLARLYLSRMQYAYGPNAAKWGSTLAGDGEDEGGGKASGKESGKASAQDAPNLYAEQLRGTEGAVLSRTSNVYGMLTTDDPFQFLGGIGLAVRHLDGKAPQLYISNLRKAGGERLETAAQFLAKELSTRQFHPGYIKGLMAEGYAGTLEVLDATNNFWGWTAVSREIVRDDQWQEMMDVYVRDKHQLGLNQWFEKHNPHAQAQTIERMVEAIRQGYWRTDKQTLADLKARYVELARKYDVRSENAPFTAFVNDPASTAPAPGFGLEAPAAAAPAEQPAQPQAEQPPETPPEQAADTPPAETVRGMQLERQQPPPPPDGSDETDWQRLIAICALLALMAAGAASQARAGRKCR